MKHCCDVSPAQIDLQIWCNLSQMLSGLFVEIDRLVLRFTGKCRRTRRVKTTLRTRATCFQALSFAIFVSLVKCLFKYMLIFRRCLVSYNWVLCSGAMLGLLSNCHVAGGKYWKLWACLVGPLEVSSQGDRPVAAVGWWGVWAEASAAEGLARASLWSSLAVRELQASEGQRPGKGGPWCQMGSFFFCPPQLVAPESGATLL